MQHSQPSREQTKASTRSPRQGLVKVSTDSSMSDIDVVVLTTKQLRQRLVNELGAQGLSFHECLDSLVGRLPGEDMRRLRFIATVRNKILNELGRDTLESRASFMQAVDQSDAGITLLAAAQRAQAAAGEARQGPGALRGPAKKAGCFIATAVYPYSDAPQLSTLRRYRDETLMSTAPGRVAVRIYYRWSPPLAAWLSSRPACAALVRRALNAWTRRLERE